MGKGGSPEEEAPGGQCQAAGASSEWGVEKACTTAMGDISLLPSRGFLARSAHSAQGNKAIA
ncbi:hypothetical protein GCM10022275_19560 [Tessaracoccus defluvii]